MLVGNPSSGTTLTRTLLNAHPEIVVSVELNILKEIEANKSWRSIVGRILYNAQRFDNNPFWTGINYRIAKLSGRGKKPLRVIGDKRAADTAAYLARNPALLFALHQWSPVPVRFIHCVRHPCDVIATRIRRGKLDRYGRLDATYNLHKYVELEKIAAQLFSVLGERRCLRFYHEELIEDPIPVLQQLTTFLGVQAGQAYFDACRSLIYKKPNKSRLQRQWTTQERQMIERETASIPHLARYFDNGHLSFDA